MQLQLCVTQIGVLATRVVYHGNIIGRVNINSISNVYVVFKGLYRTITSIFYKYQAKHKTIINEMQ